MLTIIEEFNDIAGWTVTGAVSVFGLNDHKEYVAGLNDQSLILDFPVGSNGNYAEKVLTTPIDVSSYKEIVFSIASTYNGKKREEHTKPEDYLYEIDLGFGIYLMPIFPLMDNVIIALPSTSIVTKIKITAITNTADYIYISHMVAVVQELPLDLFIGAQTQLRQDIFDKYGNGILVGKVNCNINDTKIKIYGSKNKFVQRYTVIRIVGGGNDEIHNLSQDIGDNSYILGSLFDGKKILNRYIDADIFIHVPVEYGTDDTEITLTSITIWGFDSEPISRGSKLEKVNDSPKSDGTIQQRREGQITVFSLLIDIESKHHQLMAELGTIVRNFIDRGYVWVNGKKLNIESRPSRPFDVERPYGIIPKIQYNAEIELKEDIWNRITLNKVQVTNLTIQPISLLP